MEEPVPVTMGSPRFVQREAGGFLFTHALFPPGAALAPHVHERTTFATIVEGSFDLEFSSPALTRRTRACPPSTVFTEPAGEKHANYVCGEGARALVIQPDPGEAELLEPVERMLDRINHFRHAGITDSARRMIRELEHPDELTPVSLEALALDMLATAARLEPDRSPAPGLPDWLERAREVVHERYHERLRIADVASAVGMHPAHLARTFKSHFGIPLGAFIRRVRLTNATRELLEGSKDLSRIAFEHGYADQSHFTRAFKRYWGEPPGRFRRKRRSS